jgi:hypothetical protein
MLEENEVSVYDLKDHPDFQYRPGTVVIRVANFEGEDANCTAGQVLDNYPEGMVRILIIVFQGNPSKCQYLFIITIPREEKVLRMNSLIFVIPHKW